jgi:glycerol kinase
MILDELAGKVNDTHGVYFVPAFSGLFAPHWRDDARGCIVGMTQYTNKCHIARATLEAVCFQSRDIIDCMNMDCQYPVQSLKVDGGLSNSDLMMQIQADFSGIRIGKIFTIHHVERPRMRETTALGAAMAAGYTVGLWPSLKEFELDSGIDVFRPQMPPEGLY